MTHSKKTILGMMLLALLAGAAFGADAPSSPVFPVPLSDYPDAGSLPGNLDARIKAYPFNLFASIIFLCAIVHTFCHRIFIRLADKVKARNFIRLRPHQENICCRILHMLGEVEVVFAFWLIPLFAGYIFVFGWGEFTSYIHNTAYVSDKYAEPVFVVAIMAMASTKPVVHFASCFIRIFAKIGGGTIKAWWCAILCVGPLLGSFIGSILVVPFAMLASTNIIHSRVIVAAMRLLLSIIRTLPTLVSALIATYIFGLGTLAGTTAIAIFTFAYIGKILYEEIETVDMGPFEAMEAMGATKVRAFISAIVPQVLPSYLSNCLFCFEGNVRYASILGYVGAGGLGLILNEKIGWREYASVGMILLALFVTVFIIETISRAARKRLV